MSGTEIATRATAAPPARRGRQERREHAVVLGAGIAGILAARVLSDAFTAVTVIDRDDLAATDATTQRRGVPQGRHPHVLLEAGRRILEELFPGVVDELRGHGATAPETLVGTRSYLAGGQARPTATGLTWVLASRPLLETVLRRRLLALPGMTLRPQLAATGLLAAGGSDRITGVRVGVDGAEAEESATIEADLVVDATGRASRSPDWLASLGHGRPPEERVDVDLGFSSRTYRRRPEHADGHLAVNMSIVAGHRGGYALGIEGDRWHVTVAGTLGDRPPHDDAGHRAFAATLPADDIGRLVAEAEPLDDPVPYRFRGSLRRRYDRLPAPPEGLVVLGDALCSLNPTYGQGMTVAAQEALALRACLASRRPGLPGRFQRLAARRVDVAWGLSTNGDLAHPDVAGSPSRAGRLLGTYQRRAVLAAHRDPHVAKAFFRVLNLVAPPTSLLAPTTLVRVLSRRARPRVDGRRTRDEEQVSRTRRRAERTTSDDSAIDIMNRATP